MDSNSVSSVRCVFLARLMICSARALLDLGGRGQLPAFRKAHRDCASSATSRKTRARPRLDIRTSECPRDPGSPHPDARRRRRSNWPGSVCLSALQRGATARRFRVGSVTACGERMTSSPSLFSSRATISTALRSVLGTRRHREYRPDCLGSSAAAKACSVLRKLFGDNSASLPPHSISASVASTPGPPPLVTIARRGPAGRGCLPSNSARSNNSAIVSTRRTPTRRNAASSTSSLPVSAPVCEAAAFAAASGAADLDHDDRFRERDFARGGKKRTRVADRFHVKQDAARVRIVAEMINQIAPVHIEHRADGDEGAEAELD